MRDAEPIAALPPHPPFCPGPASGREWSTKEGARALGNIIQAAWKSCGHDVPVEIVCTARDKDGNHVFWAVAMPTLINGLPTRKIGA